MYKLFLFISVMPFFFVRDGIINLVSLKKWQSHGVKNLCSVAGTGSFPLQKHQIWPRVVADGIIPWSLGRGLCVAGECTPEDDTHQIYYSFKKISGLIFFCKNLVDFNEAHLREMSLNLHTHTWNFFHLSIVSVDDKQHLSEVVFSAVVRFLL